MVADIHGNVRALEAVIADLERERPDQTVHGGDLAVNGPCPAEVMDRVRELGWPGIVGNTDQALWELPASAPAAFSVMAPATAGMLGPERVAWLRTLPMAWRGAGIALVHAVPGDA